MLHRCEKGLCINRELCKNGGECYDKEFGENEQIKGKFG